MDEDISYKAFLLRCWKKPHGLTEKSLHLHISLHEVGGAHDRTTFDSAEALFAYLKDQLNDLQPNLDEP